MQLYSFQCFTLLHSLIVLSFHVLMILRVKAIVSSILHHANFDSKQIPVHQNLSAWKYTMSSGLKQLIQHKPPLCYKSFGGFLCIWRYCKALCDVKFSQIERNCRKIHHIERHQLNFQTVHLQGTVWRVAYRDNGQTKQIDIIVFFRRIATDYTTW